MIISNLNYIGKYQGELFIFLAFDDKHYCYVQADNIK